MISTASVSLAWRTSTEGQPPRHMLVQVLPRPEPEGEAPIGQQAHRCRTLCHDGRVIPLYRTRNVGHESDEFVASAAAPRTDHAWAGGPSRRPKESNDRT